jgi:hypothetical protein
MPLVVPLCRISRGQHRMNTVLLLGFLATPLLQGPVLVRGGTHLEGASPNVNIGMIGPKCGLW